MWIAGMKELKKCLNYIQNNKEVYSKGGVSVPHFIMNLKKRNGQSTISLYITEILKENSLRKFYGMDKLLEYTLDGSLKQLQSVFCDIKSNAVFRNEYEGVVAMDITNISDHINEYQMDLFVEEIRNVSKKATMIFFYDDSKAKKMGIVKDRLFNVIGKYLDIHVSSYSDEEYADIVIIHLKDKGYIIDPDDMFKDKLKEMIRRYDIANAKEAVSIVDDIALCADYEHDMPRINAEMMNKLLKSDNLIEERRSLYEK